MHSDAASQGGGWWQGCGAAYESFSRLLDGFTSSAACDGDRRVRKARQPRQRDGIAGRRGGELRGRADG